MQQRDKSIMHLRTIKIIIVMFSKESDYSKSELEKGNSFFKSALFGHIWCDIFKGQSDRLQSWTRKLCLLSCNDWLHAPATSWRNLLFTSAWLSKFKAKDALYKGPLKWWILRCCPNFIWYIPCLECHLTLKQTQKFLHQVYCKYIL